jgi:hypothetical protein
MLNVSDPASNRGIDLRRLEALREQIPLNALHHRPAAQLASTEAPVQRLNEQGALVNVGKHLGHGRFCDAAFDAECFELPQHAEPAVPLDMCFGSRARKSGAAIVQRALLTQPVDGLVDLVSLELPALETDADLRLAQLTPGKHPQARYVGVGHGFHCTVRAKVKGQRAKVHKKAATDCCGRYL